MAPWRTQLHDVIFEADTPAGKTFDVVLLVLILASVVAVMLQTVASVDAEHHVLLESVQWIITILFTIEYGLRLLVLEKPARYVFSFFGVIDLLAILPTWLAAVGIGKYTGIVLRSLRLLRVFRIFHMGRVVHDANALSRALRASANKILVFLSVILTLVVILGTAMYLVEHVEGSDAGFTSIPESMYWAVVTMTTVGYGDIAPQTVLGKAIASIVMIMGYSLIVVPTGIVSAEAARARPVTTQSCPSCTRQGHDPDATHCKYCGAALDQP